MAITFEELRRVTLEGLVQLYDNEATHHSPGVDFYRQEIFRREQEQQANVMRRCTLWITVMTLVMTVATIVNVWIAIR